MEVMTDLFTYVKDKNIAIDINSKWFQELWYPLSKKQGVLLTPLLFNWLGYEGRLHDQKKAFQKLLNNNKIPYEEISYNDFRFLNHQIMQREIEQTGVNNLNQKRWLVMETRNFKKAVMRLNTKNAEIIRDYYMNLEEVCFEYTE